MSSGRSHALLLAAAIIWGWTFVATKIALAEVGPVELFSLRLVIGLPALAILLVAKRVPLRFTPDDLVPLMVGGSIFAAHFLIQIAGLITTTATNTSWIIAVSPLVLAILSYIFLGERIGWRGVAGIAIATVGIVILISGGRLTDLGWLTSTGDWLVIASAHTWAIYTVVTRDLVRRREPMAVTFGVLLIASIIMAAPFVMFGDLSRIRSLSAEAVGALLYLGVPGLALGQWFWQEGVAALGATRAGLYLYLEPISTLVLAVPLLNEPFGPYVVIGGALVLGGVYLGQGLSDRAAT